MNFLSTHDTERALTFLEDERVAATTVPGRLLPPPLPPKKYNQGIQLMSMAYALLYIPARLPTALLRGRGGHAGAIRTPSTGGYYDWDSTENRLKPILQQLAELRRNCDAFAQGGFPPDQVWGGVLHSFGAPARPHRIGRDHCKPHQPAALHQELFGRNTEVETPASLTILVEDTKTY